MDLQPYPLPSLDLLDSTPASGNLSLRALLASPEFHQLEPTLSLALGQTVEGAVRTADLSAMPHLLIGGAQLTGKRTFLKAILTTLLLRCRPADLRLLLVDSTGETLRPFADLPHLIAPILTEDSHSIDALMWAIGEMERRYAHLAAAGARSIDRYNTGVVSGPRGVTDPGDRTRMPHIVVVLRDLAPVMRYARESAGECIFNLSCMARAAGIHLVIVVEHFSPAAFSGMVSVSMHARIAFKASSPADSRRMLFRRGAEHLEPRGDAYFLPPPSLTPIRLRTPFVSDDEVFRVTNYWRSPRPPRTRTDDASHDQA